MVACSLNDISLQLPKIIEGLCQGGVRPCSKITKVTESDGLSATWMCLLEGCLPIQLDSQRRRRCVVDSSLKADITALTCGWQSFVYLTLALGVLPNDLNEALLGSNTVSSPGISKEIALKDERDAEKMLLSVSDSFPTAVLTQNVTQISFRRALAWDLVMVLPAKNGHLLVPLIAEDELKTKVDSAALKAPGHIFGTQREISSAQKPLQAALVWTLYIEDMLHSNNPAERELLPVPQEVLKIREDAIEDLLKLPNRLALLKDIFNPKPTAMAIDERLRTYADTTTIVGAGRTPTNNRIAPVDLRMDLWTELQANETFKLLWAQFNPSRKDRTPTAGDLSNMSTPVAVLARVILATSEIQRWEKEQWKSRLDAFGHNVPVVPPSAMVALMKLQDSRAPGRIDVL